jgi:VanZ family protein
VAVRSQADQEAGSGGRRWRRAWPADVVDRVIVVCLLGWMALAAYLFFTPDPERVTDQVDPALGHVLVFAAIGGTAAALIGPRRPQQLAALFAVGLVAGLAVEVFQEVFSPYRGFAWLDIAADAVGLALGIGAVQLAHWGLRRPRLVAEVAAVVSATVLIVSTTAVAIGPAEIRRWWECRGAQLAGDGALLSIDPTGVHVAGDAAATASLDRQLSPHRVAGGYRFDGSGGVGVQRAPTVTCSLRRAGAFTLAVDLDGVPHDLDGPARIVTLSSGPQWHQVDLHLGVSDGGASVRMRTAQWDLHATVVDDVLDAGAVRLVLTYDGTELELRADGEVVHREAFDADLSWWRLSPLTVGDEHGGDRALVGTIRQLHLYRGVVAPGT